VCEKKRFLDAVDHGVHNDYTRGCGGGDDNDDLQVVDLLCKAYYEGYKSAIKSKTANIYPLLAKIMDEMYDTTWAEAINEHGDPIPCLDQDSPDSTCELLLAVGGVSNFEIRCGPESGNCELRPYYVYGINLYPSKLEAILTPEADSTLYPEYNALLSGGFCDPDHSFATWDPVEWEWWR